MMAIAKQTISPCLWFAGNGEEAARFYVSIFPNSRIVDMSYYGKAGTEVHGQKSGSVMTVRFELDGLTFMALNGGPQFKFDEAVSFQVFCDTQAEIDRYWKALTAEGGQEGPCGWLKDKFGLSWQIVPSIVPRMIAGGDQAKADRAMAEVMKMKKLDIARLEAAYEGTA
jgi:predicted 3-demethylubiquinone-9 3-methyltransferase (glyoxalase superfamily)